MTAARKQKPSLAEIGQGAWSGIVDMVAALTQGTPRERETARETIQEDALSVQVRSGWCDPGSEDLRVPEEYELLLGSGGPAVRIVGKLSNGDPSSARLETQDWGTPWTEYRGVKMTRGKWKGELADCPDEDVLLEYARCFYFGEG